MFMPKSLSKAQIESFFVAWLVQAETKAIENWANYKLHPENEVLKVSWEAARDDVTLLEGERDRCLAVVESNSSRDFTGPNRS